MDPNANVGEQIHLLAGMTERRAAGKSSRTYAARYDELRAEYSRWRASGGFACTPELHFQLIGAKARLVAA